MSNTSETPIMKLYHKKVYCLQHGDKFTLRCEYQHCPKPLICSSCIDSHFHHQNSGKLIVTKFDSTQYSKKFNQLQKLITKEDFGNQAKVLKSFIDGLKLSMVSIYKDYRQFHAKKDLFMAEINKPFDLGMMDKVQETINIGLNLRNALDTLRSKVNIKAAQNVLINVQKEDNGGSPDNTARSVQQNGESTMIQRKIIFQEPNELISAKNFKKDNKQYEQGQVIMYKSPKQNSMSIPIEIQAPNHESEISKNGQSNSHEKKQSQEQIKNPSEVQKNYSFKNSFDQLFSNNSKNLNLNNQGNTNLKPNFINLTPKTAPLFNGNAFNDNNGTYPKTFPPNKIGYSSNQNLKIYERDFFMKKNLTIFLQQRIKNFTWGISEQIYSSFMPYKPIQKFHQLLQERRNLLFIFIGDSKILGSYYPSKYPKLTQKLRNDPNSFLFISNDQKSKIIQFKAVPSEFHLSVSDRLYICHGNTPSYADGIRTIQRNFNQLNYYLPSESFKNAIDVLKSDKKGNEQKINLSFSGSMKVKEFFVLQLAPVEQASVTLY